MFNSAEKVVFFIKSNPYIVLLMGITRFCKPAHSSFSRSTIRSANSLNPSI